MAQKALKYDLEVTVDGRVELQVQLPVGTRVTLFIIAESTDVFDDLLSAAQSSFGFWDNLYDDEDWEQCPSRD